MLSGLDRLNRQLRNENSQPLKIGIGIHHSEAIVGAMGPPKSQIITAIGDTVNTCARLESLTKEFNVPVVVSRQAAEAAGLDVGGYKLQEVPVKGRVAKVEFYALATVPELPNLTENPRRLRSRTSARALTLSGVNVSETELFYRPTTPTLVISCRCKSR